ncbi:glycine decarboxylase t-protein [Phaeodactylum tricornutum CCAP 1055/1]|jgi:aminomethyltransferase|uniref:Aminomethyltransferase n=1 Tax=Phaeodactylum tricornutum (strain CCAP 1055/1) TaxID=556484 RepID=B7S451_PHATC|nr:glycine decarboxylase t-protein [Phaeodactylum tricornutum CCAP 1055/1]EEC42576.1 glycine decarboxylase t-protein [Phaeodactylum tricornutum CCAP 1055/1]|eukprot:XP_002176340.1 glycine decarboxylase t-protein [Phaeodactylum tricornutum CCAP 1055/1]
MSTRLIAKFKSSLTTRATLRKPALCVPPSRSFAAESENLVKTALYNVHKDLGGDMVPFAGYELPVLYKGENGGVMKEHLWCRADGKASLFDVSHMGQIRWHGKDRVAFLERVVVGDIASLKEGMGCLSLVTNEKGGIIDDTVITNAGDHVFMVVNGATKFGDMKHFEEQMAVFDGDVTMEYLEDSMQLLAVQGPGAAASVAKLLPSDFDMTRMPFMSGRPTTLDGVDGCRITRCGYTGEDGFEIAMPTEHAVSIASKLMEDSSVNPTGLGARDSLRLEAGLCLYGNDLNEDITPVEGVLGWTLGPAKSRRRTEGGFLGAEHILTPDGKLQKVNRKRVGIMGMKAPARDHTEIFDENGENKIGEVTSGTFSPCLKAPIAMGYVETASAKAGTPIMLKIRNKMQKAEITKMPFVESRYYRVPE